MTFNCVLWPVIAEGVRARLLQRLQEVTQEAVIHANVNISAGHSQKSRHLTLQNRIVPNVRLVFDLTRK